ncbi:MAG TPA: hypothetical protein VES40_11620 [Ilumatobacteraceae bacterium]|nr:hypothetical protein [Ilumatobacteraceae bacterium]
MTAPKKSPAKKSPAKESAAKKPAAKRPAAKKSAAKKSAAKTRPGTPTEQPPSVLRDGDDVVGAAAQIIAVFEAQPDLFLAAGANPVRAMRDAGIELSPRAGRYVALRCRFAPAEAERLDKLAQQIDEHLAGDAIDLDDDAALADALRKIGIEVDQPTAPGRGEPSPDIEITAVTSKPDRPTAKRKPGELHPIRRSVLAAAATLPQVQRWRETQRSGPDPFARYEAAHPVMKPLLEYRRRSATQPRFAADEVYEQLARTKNGQLSNGINISLRVRLNGGR